MLINLRVKTLDSQDHEFSVEDDVSSNIFLLFESPFYVLFFETKTNG